MGWGVTVSGEGLPDVQERVSSFCSCPGNVYYCVMDLCGSQLKDMEDNEKRADALKKVIEELDKGDGGKFNNAYCVDADEKWSKGRETRKEWVEWLEILVKRPDLKLGFRDYPSFCGHTVRNRCREEAVRFFLYYKSGYDVKFEW